MSTPTLMKFIKTVYKDSFIEKLLLWETTENSVTDAQSLNKKNIYLFLIFITI